MVYQCINIRQVPTEVLNVNAWKTMFDPYIKRKGQGDRSLWSLYNN